MITESSDVALLRLLQLSSPTLPVGAYAYSQGMEHAVESGWLNDEFSIETWIKGLLQHPLRLLDVPVLARLYYAWQSSDAAAVRLWTVRLYASREAAELQREDHHLGTALARLLSDLGLNEAAPWRSASRVCFATLFSLAAVHWRIALKDAAIGYVWAWCENQIAAATKLAPLGQTAGQQILMRLIDEIDAVVAQGLRLPDEDIGCAAPGLALASALHETQYSRLFRS